MANERSDYLYRFLDSIFDLFPKADKDLFATYWSGLVQVAAAWLQTTLETDLGGDVFHMPTFEMERWDEYTFSPDTAVMDVFTETLTLVGTAPATLGNRAVFYNTLGLTNAAGAIGFSETIAFSGDEEVQLSYGSILPSTVVVTAGGIPLIEGHDYVVNYELGQVQRTPNTNIPPDQLLNVSYKHASYRLGADYVVDQVNNKVAKVVGSTIPDGTVKVSYVRDQTPGPPLVGTAGVVASSTTLVDPGQNFTGFLPGRTLTVTSPPGVAGAYSIVSALSRTTIEVTPSFPTTGDTDVVYSIDACPYGMVVNHKIVSIPVLQDRITNPTQFFYEGIDYAVANGQLGFRSMPPFNTLGPPTRRLPIFWAEKTLVNNETPYRNFGNLINFYRPNSQAYVNAMRGLFYALVTGSTNENLVRGIQILLGLPFAPSAGTVISLVQTTRTLVVQAGDNVVAATKSWTFANASFTNDDIGRVVLVSGSLTNNGAFTITQVDGATNVITQNDFPVNVTFTGAETVKISGAPATIVIRNDRSQDVTVSVPLGVSPTVAVGDVVTPFQPLSTGVQIFDKVNDPGFIKQRVGLAGITRFMVPGATADDIQKALVFLEQHLFLPTVNVNAVQGVTNVSEINHFLNILKPTWTTYIFGFADEFEESITFGETLSDGDFSFILDLTTRVVQNELNLADLSQVFVSTAGSVVSSGGTLILRDLVSNLSSFVWDDGIEIEDGPNAGAYQVISVSGTDIKLTPPLVVVDSPVTYRYFPKQLALSHDAPELTDQSYTSGTGATVTGGVLTDATQMFLHNGVVAQMLVLVTSGGVPVTGPAIPGLFTITAVTQTTLTLSPAPANGSYDYEFSMAFVRATGGAAGLPLTQAI